MATRLGHDGVRHPWRTVLLVQAVCEGCLTPAARTAREYGDATGARRCQTPLAHRLACAGRVRGVSDTCSKDRPRIWRRDWGTTVSDTYASTYASRPVQGIGSSNWRYCEPGPAGGAGATSWREGSPRRGPRAPGGAPEPSDVAAAAPPAGPGASRTQQPRSNQRHPSTQP